MSTPSPLFELLRQSLLAPSRGVIGLVDNLLTVCREQDLQLDWHNDRCHVRSPGEHPEELLNVPFRKWIFRAILARIAVVCNEQVSDAVSPYGGQAEIRLGAKPTGVFRVAFTNTPGEQHLTITRLAGSRCTGLLRQGPP
jgi:hypothetical protein